MRRDLHPYDLNLSYEFMITPNSEIGYIYNVPNTIDTVIFKDCLVQYFFMDAVRGRKLHLENLEQGDDSYSGFVTLFAPTINSIV